MLLLMTLAVLASSTCRAQEIHGNSVGTYFYIRGEDQGELKGIRVYLTLINSIKGVQLLFGNRWSDVYGTRSLKSKEFLLKDGEHVIQVDGSEGLCLTSLNFTTDKGRVASFGIRKGRTFSDTGGSKKDLVTVYGVHSPGFCIKGMGFKWGPVPEPMGSSDDSKEKDDESEGGKDSEKDKDADDDDDDDEDEDDQEKEKEEGKDEDDSAKDNDDDNKDAEEENE
ncbi:prostatic spermine-binding protein-like [Acomys russatus]|uniref:prostatic spermine-binding protein-like n=1 Tax=Acomys russatus TaxID=60746 RepID=UPI0021E1C08B|nr:prostatic spermine-binding protein-like [Acomys russatus]